MTREKDKFKDFYGEIQTAHIYALYKNGNFYDLETREKVQFEEKHTDSPYDPNNPSGILVKIIAPLYRVTDNDYERHKKIDTKEILKAETEVLFEMEKYGSNERLRFVAKILQDLIAYKKGNKEWKLNACRCILMRGKEVYTNKEFELEAIEADSLNQLFTKVSIRHRPDNASHNCNVFKTFRVLETGTLLDNLR